MGFRSSMAATLLALATSLASAHAQTAAELADQLEAEMGETAQLRDLLTHPDPARARGAMRLMLASGNPDLMRMALGAGLSSGDPVARRMALEGYFSSGPVLQMTFDGSGLEDTGGLGKDMNALSGTMSSAGTGYTATKLGEYDEAQSCWLWAGSRKCGVRLSDAGVSLALFDKWAPMALEDDATLRGEHSLYYSGVPVPVSVAVAP